MAQWAPFIAAAALLTGLLLVLAHRSQSLVHDTLDQKAESTAVDGCRLGEPIHSEQEPAGPHGLRQWRPDDSLGEPQSRQRDQTAPRKTDRADRHVDIELTTNVMLANVVVTQSIIAVLVVAGLWYFLIPGWAIGVTGGAANTGPVAVAIGLVFGLALWIGNELVTGLAAAVGASHDETVRGLLAPDSTRGWVVLFGVALPIIAVAEELLFRAALIGVPAGGYEVSPWLLVAISSVVFAFGHGAQGRVGIAVTGALGFVLGAGYVLSGSLLVVVIAHYVVNAMEFYVHEYHGLPNLSETTLERLRLS